MMSTNSHSLRSADVVMGATHSSAVVPTPLSFSRNMLRKMVAERWRIDRQLFELDSEGRGEALYRIETPDDVFHFYIVSDYFPPDQKIDRAFGINWDVSAALCEGEWTPERRELLNSEVPKQYDGRYPSDVFCFCRGNRSERIFDHVVDALAAGNQPDTALLASVGYLLRSTAFAGNGLFGMKPFEALERTHALGGTYHAQILSAYLLRTFVFDLAEHLAAARSDKAVALEPAISRYLGLGNSAGLGLVPFIMNHPRIIHQWCLAQESAIAEAVNRNVDLATLDLYRSLTKKAHAYYRQDQRDGNQIFADYAKIAADFKAICTALDRVNPTPGMRWQAVLDNILPANHQPETAEANLSLLLELFPDIVAKWAQCLVADETDDLDPAMTTGELATIIHEGYQWVAPDGRANSCPHFWYYPLESPYEPRRGQRGTGTTFEVESPMDVPRLLPYLSARLAPLPDHTSVGVFVAHNPDFALLVRRLQSVGRLPYAELRVDSLSSNYLPFGACRFLLAFYGMEKYDPRLPRSTKGALLQGAPLPDEIANGVDGSWPFPLAPEISNSEAPVIVPLRLMEQQEVAIGTLKQLGRKTSKRELHSITVFPAELRKLLTRAICGAGLNAASADTAVRLALLSDNDWVDVTLAALETRSNVQQHCANTTIVAAGLPDFAIASAVLDLAGGLAGQNIGIASGVGAKPTPLLAGLAVWGAQRNYLTAVVDATSRTISIAGGSPHELWQGRFTAASVQQISHPALAEFITAIRPFVPDGTVTVSPERSQSFTAFCKRQTLTWAEVVEPLRKLCGDSLISPQTITAALRRPIVEGFQLSPAQFQKLYNLAQRGLVPPDLEPIAIGQTTASS